MISGLGNSIYSALRTANAANSMVERSISTIATGQKVTSVKDDGGTYAHANGLRSENIAREALALNVATIRQKGSYTLAAADAEMELAMQMRDKALKLSEYVAGSTQFNQLRDELKADYIAMSSHENQIAWGAWQDNLTNVIAQYGGDWNAVWWNLNIVPIQNMDGTTDSQRIFRGSISFGYASSDGWDANGYYRQVPDGSRFYTTDNNRTELVINTAAMAKSLANFLADSIANIGAERGWAEATLARVDRHEAQNQRMADIAESYVSSLIYADLSKTSAQQGLAQSRQEMAYTMLQNALSQYSDFAGGLLNNVLSTQQKLRA